MNELTTFKHEQFGTIRGLLIDGEPWFVAADVCKALDISNTTDAIKRLDDDERARFNLGQPYGDVNIINEFGLYMLVMGSRKSGAKAFKHWIAHDVVPAIRKTGGYVANDELFINTYLPFADEQTKTLFKCVLQTIDKQNHLIAEMRPKSDFADSVIASDDGMLVGTFAKILKQNGVKTGQNRLFAWMRENGYLMKEGEWKNKPTQVSMELGLFKLRESVVEDAEGKLHTHSTPLVTGKGQVYFVNKFLGKKPMDELA